VVAVVVAAATGADARVNHGGAGAGSGSGSASAKPKHPRAWPLPAAGPTLSGDPELIFTFDDGPNRRTTPQLLDVLEREHVRATFFVVGRAVLRDPAILRRVHDELKRL